MSVEEFQSKILNYINAKFKRLYKNLFKSQCPLKKLTIIIELCWIIQKSYSQKKRII